MYVCMYVCVCITQNNTKQREAWEKEREREPHTKGAEKCNLLNEMKLIK